MKKFELYAGIDVSKLTLDVTVLNERGDGTETTHYKIENNEKSIARFVKKRFGACRPEQVLFCFEDTGIYSMPLAYYLSDKKMVYWQVAAIEVKRSKGITRGKSDKIDSKDIAFYAYSQTHKFRPSIMSAKSIQKLRLQFTEREKIIKGLALFGKTAENKGFISKEVYNEVVSVNRAVINSLHKAQKQIEDQILAIISEEEQLKEQYKLITSISGIWMQTAVYLIIATKGFETFENWRQLACYAGVAPFPYESGTSVKKRTQVHHFADKKLKTLLNMCAMVAVRHDKELKTYYERKVEEGKAKMLVLNNVRGKLLARVFAVVNRGTPFVNTQKFAS
jgi:transposase